MQRSLVLIPAARSPAACREQLKRSNALRARGQRALEELRGEFEALTRDLAGGDAVATLTLASPGACGPPTALLFSGTLIACRLRTPACLHGRPLSRYIFG